MKAFMEGGTLNLDLWDQGEQVKDLQALKVGDILLDVNHQFRAHNLCRITRLDECTFREPGEIVYAIFVNPEDTSKLRQFCDQEFAIWDFELSSTLQQFFRMSPSKQQMKLTGSMVVRLMRTHKVKMRDIKAATGITLKRIREVREKGVQGFAAEEWMKIITGKWPDPGWSQAAQ